MGEKKVFLSAKGRGYQVFRPQVREIALLGSITTFEVLSALEVGALSRFYP